MVAAPTAEGCSVEEMEAELMVAADWAEAGMVAGARVVGTAMGVMALVEVVRVAESMVAAVEA
eukprot:3431318-Prymnesium_polylepis.1